MNHYLTKNAMVGVMYLESKWERAMFCNGGTKKTRVLEGWWRSIQFSIFSNRESRGDQRSSLKGHFGRKKDRYQDRLKKKTVEVDILRKRTWVYMYLSRSEGGDIRTGEEWSPTEITEDVWITLSYRKYLPSHH